MAPLTFNPLISPVPSCSTSLPIVVLPISRLQVKAINAYPSKCLIGTQFVPDNKTSVMIAPKASSASNDGAEQQLPVESKNEDLSLGKLPLESKTQILAEQRIRMKLAKKIRLRRKRLVRKRKLRKKGRWPPSKMKKLKNV